MAEEKLNQLLGQRLEFTATVGPRKVTGVFKGGPIETVALEGLRLADTGEQIADLASKDVGKWAEGLREGDQITFCATVAERGKRFHGSRLRSKDGSDYTFKRPHIVSVSRRK